MKILLIEDEKLIRITLTDTIKKVGFDVVACSTGEEGLSLLENPDFDVIVTDLRLPQALVHLLEELYTFQIVKSS